MSDSGRRETVVASQQMESGGIGDERSGGWSTCVCDAVRPGMWEKSGRRGQVVVVMQELFEKVKIQKARKEERTIIWACHARKGIRKKERQRVWQVATKRVTSSNGRAGSRSVRGVLRASPLQCCLPTASSTPEQSRRWQPS